MALKSGCKGGCFSVLGALFIGALIPALLFSFHAGAKGIHGSSGSPFLDFVMNVCGVFLIGLIYGGPLAFVLALVVYGRLSPERGARLTDDGAHLRRGLRMGLLMAFLNVPAYLSAVFLQSDDSIVLNILRMFVVFSLTGSACGFWIALVTWREQNPNQPLIRFSLQSMMIGVFIFGAVLALFAPVRK